MQPDRLIYVEKIPTTDNRLKRHVRHDSRSKNYQFDTRGLTIQDVLHNRSIPILDQGDVGSCTGNAGIGDLATAPFTPIKGNKYSLDEEGAQHLYSDAQILDGNGPYPPNDNGSSGLSVAAAMKNAGLISSFQHTFSLEGALKALTKYPIMVGTNWYQDMYMPDADGRVHPTGRLVGGHEYLARQIVTDGKQVWFDNSWGEKEWGINGRFYMTFEDFGFLLAQRGDVTVPIPKSDNPVPLVRFSRQLQYRTEGADVIDLQKRLNAELAHDGIPCFRYHTASTPAYSQFFGLNTRAAVQRYQETYGIAHEGDIGYGRVGPLTLSHLNQ